MSRREDKIWKLACVKLPPLLQIQISPRTPVAIVYFVLSLETYYSDEECCNQLHLGIQFKNFIDASIAFPFSSLT